MLAQTKLKSLLIGLFMSPLSALAQTGGSAPADAPAPVAGPTVAPVVAAPSAPSAATSAAPVFSPVPRDVNQTLAQSGFVDAGPGGFSLRSADKQSQLRFHLQIQGDGRFWRGTTPAKVSETFYLRRAIPWIDGTLPHGVSFLLAPDFSQIATTNTAAQGNAAINLPDAYFQLKVLDELQFRFGKFRAPIGLERLQPTGQLFANEFAIATELAPMRDVGVQAQGELAKGFLGYAVGVFNGAVDNAYTDVDSASRYKDVGGMIYVRPFGPASPDLFQYAVFGVAGTAGRKAGGPQASGQSTNLPTYKSPGGATIFSYRVGATPDATNTVIASGQQRRFNVHGYYSVGPFGILAEYLYSQQQVGLNGENFRGGNQGWTAEASLFLYGGKASYSQAQVLTPFDLKTGNLGAFEVSARASQLRFDDQLFGDQTKPVDATVSVNRATELAGNLSWYWSRNVRFLFSYNHTSYQGGAKTGDRPAENVFFGRTQLSY